MLTGAVLVGAVGDYGRALRLGMPDAESWEDVPFRVVKEPLDGKQIKVVNDPAVAKKNTVRRKHSGPAR
jgi:hypothetical protein